MINITELCSMFSQSLPYSSVSKKASDGGVISTSLTFGDQTVFMKFDASSISTLVTLYISQTSWDDVYVNNFIEKFNSQMKTKTGFTASIRNTPDYDDPMLVLDSTITGYSNEYDLAPKIAGRLKQLVTADESNFLYQILVHLRNR